LRNNGISGVTTPNIDIFHVGARPDALKLRKTTEFKTITTDETETITEDETEK
jgi:hypothetical protein